MQPFYLLNCLVTLLLKLLGHAAPWTAWLNCLLNCQATALSFDRLEPLLSIWYFQMQPKTLYLQVAKNFWRFMDKGLKQILNLFQIRLCIKVGRGPRDACVGTWGRETRDLRTWSMGRGDVKNRDAGDAGCEWLSQKSEVNAISLSSWKCVIYDSIFQNHIRHLMMFTQIFLYNRSKRTDYRD